MHLNSKSKLLLGLAGCAVFILFACQPDTTTDDDPSLGLVTGALGAGSGCAGDQYECTAGGSTACCYNEESCRLERNGQGDGVPVCYLDCARIGEKNCPQTVPGVRAGCSENGVCR